MHLLIIFYWFFGGWLQSLEALFYCLLDSGVSAQSIFEIYKTDEQCGIGWDSRYQLFFREPVCFACEALHTVSIYRMLEASLGDGNHHLKGKFLASHFQVDYSKRVANKATSRSE